MWTAQSMAEQPFVPEPPDVQECVRALEPEPEVEERTGKGIVVPAPFGPG
jgi:hypothetical protein